MKNKEEFVVVKMMSLIIFFVLALIFINSIFIKILALNDKYVNAITFYDNNSSDNGNSSMMLPGKNMTFGSSLDNAKMHLMEAIMDIKDNNIDGALMQLNMTSNDINMHEHEMADMMFIMNNIKEANKR
jgi:hypothetical protein